MNTLHLTCLMVLLVLAPGLPALAGTIEVPGDEPTIQAGIDTASDGDTVLVAPGTYTENVSLKGRNIVLASHFALNGDTTFIRSTIIDGGSPANEDTASCVLFIEEEDSSCVLQGFTLTGGTGTKWIDEHGAGTYVEGGGILIAFSSPTIRHNIITGNEAIRRPAGTVSAGGGAIRCGDGSPLIINNIITGNTGMYGGGIVMNYASGIIKNNIITGNRVIKVGSASTFGGGGIWVLGSGTTTIIENNTVVGNASEDDGFGTAGRGGGMVVWSTPVDARNNIFWGNTQLYGGQIHERGITASVVYSDVEGGFPGDGNIDADPLFEQDTYYLTPGSPCVDAGDTSSAYNDPEDPDNPGTALFPSMGGPRADMGAFGGPDRAVLGSVPTSVEDAIPGGNLPRSLGLSQNFPNPFNPSTTIRYSLAAESWVTLAVYDLRGKMIRRLVEENQSPGQHSVHWDGRDDAGRQVSSGIYLYRLSTGREKLVRKMIMVE